MLNALVEKHNFFYITIFNISLSIAFLGLEKEENYKKKKWFIKLHKLYHKCHSSLFLTYVNYLKIFKISWLGKYFIFKKLLLGVQKYRCWTYSNNTLYERWSKCDKIMKNLRKLTKTCALKYLSNQIQIWKF